MSGSISDSFNLRPRKREKCHSHVSQSVSTNRVKFAIIHSYRRSINANPGSRVISRGRELVVFLGAIFGRDSGALWASNGERVILNNSSYRRNAQVRIASPAEYMGLYPPSFSDSPVGLDRTRNLNRGFSRTVR